MGTARFKKMKAKNKNSSAKVNIHLHVHTPYYNLHTLHSHLCNNKTKPKLVNVNFVTLHSEGRYFGKCTVCQRKVASTETVNNDYHFRLSVTCPSANNPIPRAFSLQARGKALGRRFVGQLSADMFPTRYRQPSDSI